jgi:hypothetical protein
VFGQLRLGSRTVLPCIFPPSKYGNSTKKSARKAGTASKDAKRGPYKTLRVEDCSTSIWTRDVQVQGEPRRFYSVTFERSFKGRDGAWNYTKSFDPDSLGRIVALCQQASEIIAGLEDPARMPDEAD